jgi:hypothetical protein
VTEKYSGAEFAAPKLLAWQNPEATVDLWIIPRFAKELPEIGRKGSGKLSVKTEGIALPKIESKCLWEVLGA